MSSFVAARPAPPSATVSSETPGPGRHVDLAWVAGLLLLVGGVLLHLRAQLTRPLWLDEMWRVHQAATFDGSPFGDPDSPGPAAYGYLAVEKASLLLLGNTDVGARLPMFLAWPALVVVMYRLCRWWLPPWGSFVSAALLVGNGSLVVYSLQLKPYAWEALASALAMHAWLSGRARVEDGRSPLPWHGVMAACGISALPALFVVLPLAGLDVLAAARRRDLRWVGGALLAGGVTAAHLVLFVTPQSRLLGDPVWPRLFLQGGPGEMVAGVRRGLLSFVPEVATAGLLWPDDFPGSVFEFSPLMQPVVGPRATVMTIGLLLLGLTGVVVGVLDRRARGLVVMSAAAVAALALAAALERWPFGYTRVNLWLLPQILLLSALGARALLRAAARYRPTSVLAGTLVGAVVVVAASLNAHWVEEQRLNREERLLDALPAMLRQQRTLARPGDVYVVNIGTVDVVPYDDAHRFALLEHEDGGPAGYRIPEQDTRYFREFSAAELDRLLADRPGARVFYMRYSWARPAPTEGFDTYFRERGYRFELISAAAFTGQTWLLTRP